MWHRISNQDPEFLMGISNIQYPTIKSSSAGFCPAQDSAQRRILPTAGFCPAQDSALLQRI
jgi:hypothetical protein